MDLSRLSTEAGFHWFAKVALVVFFVFFVGVVIWTLTRSRRQMKDNAQIPLEEDVVEPRAQHERNDEEQSRERR